MAIDKMTLGQAIDQMIAALEPFDGRARATILSAVSTHLGENISLQSSAASSPRNESSSLSKPADDVLRPDQNAKHIDIRTLKNEKAPASARQMACIVAYFLQELAPEKERKTTVNTADLEKYFKQAGFKLPAAMAQVLVDAKKSGYFSGDKGEYKLNAVGYNMVVHNLPASSAGD